jgi:hypothetical protein
MPSIRRWIVLVTALLPACGSEPKPPQPPEFTQAFANLPLPPNPEFVSRSGSADALQITLSTSMEQERVADYYRTMLTKGKWRLVSDLKNPDGSTALYAEQDGPPLWVRLSKLKDRPGTLVQLTGAVVPVKDSVARRS